MSMNIHNAFRGSNGCSLVISSASRPWRLSRLSQVVRHSSIDSHSRAVDRISASVRDFYERKEKFRIYHGSTNSTRHASKGTKLVNTSSLSHVLEVNPRSRTAKVEPNVPMDRLVEETLKYDLIPPVVMEFPGITVGGGYAGTSGESSSYKHGFFNHTLNSVEMVLADGDVVTCSKRDKSDLFYGAAGACGTLGVTTMVELQLIEAKKFVETTYYPVSSVVEAIQKIQGATADAELDYVDGILYSKNEGAIVTGRLTDSPGDNIPIQTFSDPKDPWFYLHAKDAIAKGTQPITEAIPLAEYLFRYDRGGFWVGASAFGYFNVPFNNFTRWWLDDFVHTRMMYTALHASGQSKKYIVQDLALPYSTAEEFVNYTDKVFGIYPLWLCPLRQSQQPTMHPHLKQASGGEEKQELMLNIGLWGYGPPRPDDFLKANQDLERELRKLGGMKWLYAQTHYTEDAFWEMYDRKWYDSLRMKYDAISLPSVYEKVKADSAAEKRVANPSFEDYLKDTWPISGLYGLKKAIESGAYLQARDSAWKSIGETSHFDTKR